MHIIHIISNVIINSNEVECQSNVKPQFLDQLLWVLKIHQSTTSKWTVFLFYRSHYPQDNLSMTSLSVVLNVCVCVFVFLSYLFMIFCVLFVLLHFQETQKIGLKNSLSQMNLSKPKIQKKVSKTFYLKSVRVICFYKENLISKYPGKVIDPYINYLY